MARVSFSEIEQWETLQGIKRAETARRLNVTSQTLNGWRLRGRVSADESDRVRRIISDSVKPEPAKSVLGSLSEPAGQGSESGPSFFEDLPRSYYTAPEDIRAAVDKLLDTSAKNTKHREALARMIHAYYETQET